MNIILFLLAIREERGVMFWCQPGDRTHQGLIDLSQLIILVPAVINLGLLGYDGVMAHYVSLGTTLLMLVGFGIETSRIEKTKTLDANYIIFQSIWMGKALFIGTIVNFWVAFYASPLIGDLAMHVVYNLSMGGLLGLVLFIVPGWLARTGALLLQKGFDASPDVFDKAGRDTLEVIMDLDFFGPTKKHYFTLFEDPYTIEKNDALEKVSGDKGVFVNRFIHKFRIGLIPLWSSNITIDFNKASMHGVMRGKSFIEEYYTQKTDCV